MRGHGGGVGSGCTDRSAGTASEHRRLLDSDPSNGRMPSSNSGCQLQVRRCKLECRRLGVGTRTRPWGASAQWAASAIKPTQHRDAEPRLIDRRLACGLHQGLGAGIPVAGPGVPRAAAPAPAPRAAQAQAGTRPARCTLGPPGPLRGMGDCGGRARAPAGRPRCRAPGDTGPLQRLRMLANAA